LENLKSFQILILGKRNIINICTRKYIRKTIKSASVIHGVIELLLFIQSFQISY
jgi:hypothetical protein